METAEELAKYSVARKLLRELSSVTISGRDILRYLQAGSLMGCLTHLSLAGCKSVRDDAAWGHRPLLTSQFAALFLANPHLQYLDMSRTGLSNNGIFFFLLELSLCDPLVTPSGLKNLKQVVVGPPTDNMDRASLASNSGTYVPSISDALAELYFQSPALQLVALLLSSDTQSAAAHENQHSDQAINEAWRLLNEDNMSGLTTLATTVAQPCLVLRTRRGDGVPVQHHAQMVAFSKERMADDWLTRDKANMDMALDGDVNARLDTRYELGEVGDWGRHRSPQHRERSMWDGLSQSGKLPRRAQQQPRLQVQPCSGKADVPYDRQPGTGASDYLCPQGTQFNTSDSPADVRGRAACAQPRMKRREYVHSKAMRQKVRSDAQPRARHVAGPSRRAGLSTRQHMPLVQSTQRTKTPRAKTASSKRRSKLMLTRIARASRTVDALLDVFAFDKGGRQHEESISWTGDEISGADQMHAWPDTDVVDLCSPAQSGLSPAPERCHSDPGAAPRQHQPHAALDHSVWEEGLDTGSDSGSSYVLGGATSTSDLKIIGRTTAVQNSGGHDAEDTSTEHKRRPWQRLLSAWNSSSPTQAEMPNTAAPELIRRLQGPFIKKCTDGHAPSPHSSAGLTLGKHTSDRAVCISNATRHAGRSAYTSPEPDDSVSKSPNSLPCHASHETVLHQDAGGLHGRRNYKNCDENSPEVSQKRLDRFPACGENQKPDSLHQPDQPRFTGAQRRRLRRQQDLEVMQMNDPQGWARLQETVQAMMPYGWDKRKEQHPIGAALDPTTFDAEECDVHRSAAARMPLMNTAAKTDNVLQPCEVDTSVAPSAPGAAVMQQDDLDSDDDFDRTFTRAPPQLPQTNGHSHHSDLPTTAQRNCDAKCVSNSLAGKLENCVEGYHLLIPVAERGPDTNAAYPRTQTHMQQAPQLDAVLRHQTIYKPKPEEEALPLPERHSLCIAGVVSIREPRAGVPTSARNGIPHPSAASSASDAGRGVLGVPADPFCLNRQLPLPNRKAEGFVHLSIPNENSTGQAVEAHDEAQQLQDTDEHALDKQNLPGLKQGGECVNAVNSLLPVSSPVEADIAEQYQRDQDQADSVVTRLTILHQALSERQQTADKLHLGSCPERPSTCVMPCRQAADERRTAFHSLGTAAIDEFLPDEDIRKQDVCAWGPEEGFQMVTANHFRSSSCPVRQKKSRAQRELDRLSVFSWDKRKGDHPVGKQLSFFHQHSRRSRSRTQEQYSTPQDAGSNKMPEEPCTNMPPLAVPGAGLVNDTQKILSTPPQKVACMLIPEPCASKARGLPSSACTHDSLVKVSTRAGSFTSGPEGLSHSSRSGQAMVTPDVADNPMFTGAVKRKKSRLSRLPRPQHRAQPL